MFNSRLLKSKVAVNQCIQRNEMLFNLLKHKVET